MIFQIIAGEYAYCLPASFIFFVLMYAGLREKLGVPKGKTRMAVLFLASWTSHAIPHIFFGKAVDSWFGGMSILAMPLGITLFVLLIGANVWRPQSKNDLQ